MIPTFSLIVCSFSLHVTYVQDISARTPQEQVYAMIMMLIGVSWYAYIVSSMSSIMSSFDAQNKAVRDKMLCVNEFVRTAKLPKDLAKQVRDFFEFKLARSQHAFLISSNYDVDELLDELGSGLRADVLLYMDRHLISKIPFLQNKVPQFVADIISMFQPMVFQESDFICKEGTQADEMFFLVKGKCFMFHFLIRSRHVPKTNTVVAPFHIFIPY